MHTGIVVWIDAAPAIEIDDDGARIIFRSGKSEFTHRTSRDALRRACVCGLRKLNEWEDAQEGVIPLPIKAGAGH